MPEETLIAKTKCKLDKQNTRQALIDAGTNIILEKGFNNTGIDQILKAVGVPKGSFYYYFKSKDDFGLSIIDYHTEVMRKDVDSILLHNQAPALERLKQYFEFGRSLIEENACCKGCLFGNLAQEMADQNETFRLRLLEVFSAKCKLMSGCIAEAQAEKTIPNHMNPDLLAEYLIFSWQGALMRCKISKSIQPVDTYLHFVFEELLKAE